VAESSGTPACKTGEHQMAFTNTGLKTVRLSSDQRAQHARHKCIWRALSRRSRGTTFGPLNVRCVSTSRRPWFNSNKPTHRCRTSPSCTDLLRRQAGSGGCRPRPLSFRLRISFGSPHWPLVRSWRSLITTSFPVDRTAPECTLGRTA
jgi:hypothetical protein